MWENILEMGPEFVKLTDQLREWRFGFNDFYDVYIWDLKPGQDEVEIFNKVSEVSLPTFRPAFRPKVLTK